MSIAAAAGICESAMRADSDVRRVVGLYCRLQTHVSEVLKRDLAILENEPSWGLLHSMSERVMEQQAACISLYSYKYFAPAEALCRTVVEGAVNLYYCSQGDACKHVLWYFRSYIETERKQNKQWLASVNSSEHAEELKKSHRDRIQRKDHALLGYEQVLTEAFSQIGVSYDKVGKEWPSIFERFKSIGKEVDYRTVYAALCSQAHNDAEDLINDFVHGVMQIDGAHEAQSDENKNFALYMVLVALTFLIEANAIYLAKFNLDALEGFKQLLKDTWQFTGEVTQRKKILQSRS